MSDIIVIGAVLWDIIGRAPGSLSLGNDVPGRIVRHPGGVALNIALALRRFGRRPALLTAIGRDPEGDDLIRACEALGLDLSFAHRHDQPTDAYMAVEGANGLIAAIADAHGLEAAGDAILKPLQAGAGPVVLDGNLTADLLDRLAHDRARAATEMLIAPASPGKALRLLPFLKRPRTTLYLNREEAALLAQSDFASAEAAARALHRAGTAHVLVTDGPHGVAEAEAGIVLLAPSPGVTARRVTGAGDTFMAAHLVARLKGHDRLSALSLASEAAARHVAGEDAVAEWIPDVQA